MRADRNRHKKRHRTAALIAVLAAVIVLGAAAVYFSFYGVIRPTVTIEAGSEVPSASVFLKRPASYIEIVRGTENADSSYPGRYTVEFRWLFLSKKASLIVADTTAPVGTLKDITAATGTRIEASDFVVSATDITPIKVSYLNEPDFSRAHTENVTILLTDSSNNVTELSAVLKLTDDSEPPVIMGAINKTVFVGETISYKSGVTVTDNEDESPRLTVDNSQVNLDAVGRYPVVYTATDAAGNSSSVTITVSVEEKPSGYENIQKVYDKADALLAGMLNGTETEIEKAYKIFYWIRTNVPWYGGRLTHDYVQQAMNALTGSSGDCYTDTVGCKVLLERAGFEVMLMERANAIGRHSWLMVRVNGEWYHMDPAPIYVHTFICFLGTDDQLLAFNELRPDYYTHDWSQYPATPTESPAEVVLKDGKYALVIK